MRQSATGGFNSYINSGISNASTFNVNVADFFLSAIAPNQPGWSSGGTIIQPTPLEGPSLSQKWSIISLSITGYLWLTNPSAGNIFGKLGRLIAGLVVDQDAPTTGTHITNPFGIYKPWTNPMLALPSDTTLTDVMWDGNIDPLPPQGPNPPSPSSMLPVTATINPPVPIKLNPQQPPYAGIWMTPSLLGATDGAVPSLALYGSSWAINYDDGL